MINSFILLIEAIIFVVALNYGLKIIFGKSLSNIIKDNL